MDKLAAEFNFTYVSQKNVDNDWGMIDINGTYGGVWGNVISKEHDMSISLWGWYSTRNALFDFVPLIKETFALAIKPQNSKIDFGLFTRAFDGGTWTSVISMSCAALSLVFLANLSGIDDMMNGVKIMMFILWLFFTLVYSYYCGVMTMFFSTTTVPFETMSDVIQAYPNWKLRFPRDGWEGWVLDMANQGDQSFLALWQRYQNNPTETTYDSIEHGLQLIENGQNVIMIDQKMVLAHLKSNPTEQNIHVISLRTWKFDCLIFHKNSPILPLFYQGASYLRETGLERQLFNKWFGELYEQNVSTPEGQILMLGQMVTVFVMMLVVFVVALIVLCGELTIKRILNRLTRHGQRRKEK